MKIAIRKATGNDLGDILRLNLDLFKKEYKEYDKRLNLKWTYGKVGRVYFNNRIIEKNSFVLVAEDEGKIIGYLCGAIKKCPHKYRIIPKYAELENMFVEKKLRNKGVGKKLVKEFLEWCKSKKIDNISVDASIQNKNGIRFYRKMGFKDYSLILEI